MMMVLRFVRIHLGCCCCSKSPSLCRLFLPSSPDSHVAPHSPRSLHSAPSHSPSLLCALSLTRSLSGATSFAFSSRCL